MNKIKISQKLLIAAGLIDILIGIFHFLWPFEIIENPSFVNLVDHAKDIVILFSFSLGICLLMFGFLAIFLAINIKSYLTLTFVFTLMQGFRWPFRLLLEILFPVQINIYMINDPTNFNLVGLLIISLLCWVSAILIYLGKNKSKCK